MANLRSHFPDKSRLRETMRRRLSQLTPSDRYVRSLQICENLRTHFAGKNSIALFAPTRTEPDLDLLWNLGFLQQHPVCYPRCDGGGLSFCSVSELLELHPGRFGIREPDAGPCPERIDLIVVPGLAFTVAGIRLGRGAGFYDRSLATLPAYTLKVGVCFEFQVIAQIPEEEHDVTVDALVHA